MKYPGINKMKAVITRIATDSDDPNIKNLINQLPHMSHLKIKQWFLKLLDVSPKKERAKNVTTQDSL